MAVIQPTLTKDFREWLFEPPTVITEENWLRRDALANKYYPQIVDLLGFNDDHLFDILWEVDQDEKPAKEFPVGAPGTPRPLAWLPKRSYLEWHLFRGRAPAARRPGIPLSVRREVQKRDGNTCQICFTEVPAGDVHLDHIKPWSQGGPDTVANLRVTHSLCNILRGAPSDAP